MTLSDIAVRRPVFALVVAMVLCIIGVVSFTRLPLRELPNVDPPQVSIQTRYVGASAEVIETQVTQIIERQVSAIPGIDRIQSSSRDGSSNVNITFTLDRNIEDAANDVRDRVSRTLSQLPDDADSPVVSKADPDGMPIMLLNLKTTMNRMQATDYLNRFVVPRLSTVNGIADMGLPGSQNYAMRVWLRSDALAARNLTVDEVSTALSRNNMQLPAGSIESTDVDYTINVDRSYMTPADFARLPISTAPDGYVVRLGDIARIEEGPDDNRRVFNFLGEPRLGMALRRQADANDLDISKGVQKAVAELNKGLPKGSVIDVTFDNSIFTQDAIFEVWVTMGIAIALVAAVNFLFLGTWQAALIPTIVAPICVLSTFTALAPLGFSLNLLTLLALVLAIGLVVDDAIVVVENIQRRIEEGEPPLIAAQRGSRQVFFAVLATTATLISVFSPLMFLPGYTGKLFIELAVAIAAAVAFSALLALTFAPVLASKLLRPAHSSGALARIVDRTMNAVRDSYRHSLSALLGQKIMTVGSIATVLVVGLIALVMFRTLPVEVVPDEDRGRVDISINAPEGAGFDYTSRALDQLSKVLDTYVHPTTGKPEADIWIVWQMGGFGGYNSANAMLRLVDAHDRSRSAQQIAADINRKTAGITGARINANIRSAFSRGGPGGGGSNTVQMIAIGPTYEQLAAWTAPIQKAANENPGMTRVNSSYEPVSPRLRVTLDRERAAALGVTNQQVGQALNTMYGPRTVGTYVREGEEYDILMQTGRENRSTPDDLANVYVRSSGGQPIPLSAVVKTELRGDLASRTRIDQQRAVTITASLNPGYTVADAVKFFEDEVAKQPAGPVILWGGAAKDLADSGNSIVYAFGFALVVVFLVLAAQFESWIHPCIILFTVPLAAAGGLFGLLMFGSTLNLYSQIGLIILIGISAKNGILIVEFANQLRDEGLSVREAVIESAAIRLRPIVMTSIATAAGALPLVLWHGPGSNSRFTIGIVIIMGCLFSTLLTVFIVPAMYNLLAGFARSPEWVARQIDAFEEDERTRHGAPVEHRPAAAGGPAIDAAE